MNWISTFGRKFLEAYREGLEMSCPVRRSDEAPCHRDLAQHDVRALIKGRNITRH
jgi:hypothetical protein